MTFNTSIVHTNGIPLDSEGRRIEPGALVAYNLSGDVVRGMVVDVRWDLHRRPKWTVKIKSLKGPYSKVKNRLSILVLAAPGAFDDSPYQDSGSRH